MTHKSIRLIVKVVLTMLLVTYCISGVVNSTQAQIRAYVANDCNGMVSVIDSTSNTVVNTISVGISPIDIAITPDGTRAYLTDRTTGTVSVIDTMSNTVVATVPVECPTGIAITPAPLSPRTKDDCKDGGYQKFGPPAGPFKNQGQCVKHVNEHSP